MLDEFAEQCPVCEASWRGAEIPPAYVLAGHYGHRSPCLKKRPWEEDYHDGTPCTCGPRYYSRRIGIEIQGSYDGVSYWQCPDCNAKWNRFTGELVPTPKGKC